MFPVFDWNQDKADPVLFHYFTKAAPKERDAGLTALGTVTNRTGNAGRGLGGLKCKLCGHWKASGNPCVCPTPQFEPTDFQRPARKNQHPTVKPIALMRWLCKLVTPPGGLVLDPFMGSGTTGCAAALEGFHFVGIEREPEFAALARDRIKHWSTK